MNAHTMLRHALLSALIVTTLLLGACAGGQVESPTEPAATAEEPAGEQPSAAAAEAPMAEVDEPAQPEDQVRTGPADEPPEPQDLVEREDLQPQFDYEPGDEIMVRKPWVQVRTAPSATAEAIALAYGNDVLPIVAVEGEWLQVRWQGDKLGWIPLSAGQDLPDPQAAKQ